jgi:two-component system, NtrC family, sensor kinase
VKAKVRGKRAIAGTAGKPAQAKVQAKRPVPGRSRETEDAGVSALKSRLAEASEHQTAITDILRVIACSPGDLKPILSAVSERALKLCDAAHSNIFLVEGDKLRSAASLGTISASIGEGQFIPLTRGSVTGRAVLDRVAIHMKDLAAAPEEGFPIGRELQRRVGSRTFLAVPLMREDRPIGAIALWRMEVRRFSDTQVALVKTFADQAAIAIENVRLFKETQEALERQTATAEILRVISESPADVQPVFDAIVQSAKRVFGALTVAATRVVGDSLHLVAFSSTDPEGDELLKHFYPMRFDGKPVAAAVRTGKVVAVSDVMADPRIPQAARDVARIRGYRSMIIAPMLCDGVVIGTINISRAEPAPFSDHQQALLKTFADQAVIAIQNARLFTELEARNRDLTATSEILRVISTSPANVQPVFDAIVKNAVQLCEARYGAVFRLDRGLVHLAAHHNISETLRALWFETFYPMAPNRGHISGRAILTGAAVQVPDILADEEYRGEGMKAAGFRSLLGVPLLHGGFSIGAIVIYRTQPGQFADKHVELLKTFADQAVIAIENVRLFTELEARTLQLTRSVEELKALGEVGRAVSSTLDLETVLSTIVSRAVQLAGMDGGSIWEYDEGREEFYVRATHRLPDELIEAHRATPIRKGEGALGRLAMTREPVEIGKIANEPGYPTRLREILIRSGYRSVLAVPLLREDHLLGALAVNRTTPGEFAPEVIALLKTFATQSALAIQNARLYREIEVKSRELEAASRHKSEFLANMSHELRTPLNAIIGFSEVLSERMFGEINDKQAEYIGDILQSGQHLLSLINEILDLSKIEAGRMELELSDFDLPGTIENTLTLVRERAQRRAITLGSTVDVNLGAIRGDERKVKQVILNLLSNALKFTPEGGKIDVRAAVSDGVAEISVTDTGVGIAPEDQDAVFEEFRRGDGFEKS